jgi:NAD(P)-dependent dehydrogenase (short-subunit alcohol dehydrogenase family)
MGNRFNNKNVLVTAAASGIGAATAKAFASEGASVMLSDINGEGVKQLAQEISASGARVFWQKTDCTDDAQIKALVEATINQLGGLDIAANIVGDSVGDAHGPEFHETSTEGWNGTLAVTLNSAYLCMKHEIAHMIENNSGAIVNVTSIAGMRYVSSAGAAYSTAKAGVIQLTRFAAVSYAERGIRVNCIAPGVTPTPAYFKAGREAAEALINSMLPEQAIKRVVVPEEQAEAILWLCSESAAMVTGHVLPIDGGWMAT